MRRHRSRILLVSALFVSGGAYLLAGSTMGCASLGAETALSSVDMCFVFDCTGGIFGGVIDPCSTVGEDPNDGTGGGGGGGAGGTADPIIGGPFFSDCPTGDDNPG
ncbi:MAG: hypothetical protein GY778_13165 [bacterium]|nr:hypothetical protein [bacterium]